MVFYFGNIARHAEVNFSAGSTITLFPDYIGEAAALVFDLVGRFGDALALRKLAAWRPDTGHQLVIQAVSHAKNLVIDPDALTEGAVPRIGTM